MIVTIPVEVGTLFFLPSDAEAAVEATGRNIMQLVLNNTPPDCWVKTEAGEVPFRMKVIVSLEEVV